MTAAALTPAQRAVLARLVRDKLRDIGRPDGAWRYADARGWGDVVAGDVLRDLEARGLVRRVAPDLAELSPMGREILARLQDAAARLTDAACRAAGARACRISRHARRRFARTAH